MFSGFSRRQVLKMIGAFITGVATLGSLSLLGKWIIGAAQAQVKAPSVSSTIYRGRAISIQTGGEALQFDSDGQLLNDVKLTIDKKQIELTRHQRSGRYFTGYLPFETFDSPLKAAKEMIDNGAPAPD